MFVVIIFFYRYVVGQDVGCIRVFLVDVDVVKVFCFNKFNNVVYESIGVVDDCLLDNVVCCWFCGVSLVVECVNFFCFEVFEFSLFFVWIVDYRFLCLVINFKEGLVDNIVIV